MKGLFISGSNTGVGKTFIACQLIKILNKKYSIKVRKPVESGCENIKKTIIPKDAVLLSRACTNKEALDRVCAFKFEAGVNSAKASEDESVCLTLNNLIVACSNTCSSDFVIVEGAGGIYSPIAQQTLNSDLINALKLPIVFVVKDELGAINQALLGVQAAKSYGLEIIVIVLNQIEPNNLTNNIELAKYTKIPIVIFAKNNIDSFRDKILALI